MDFLYGFHYDKKHVNGKKRLRCRIRLCQVAYIKYKDIVAHIESHFWPLVAKTREDPHFKLKGKVQDMWSIQKGLVKEKCHSLSKFAYPMGHEPTHIEPSGFIFILETMLPTYQIYPWICMLGHG